MKSIAVLRWLALASCGLIALPGCSLNAPQPSGVVHVADLINSVKCGLAQALMSDAGKRRLPGTIASVELELKVVDTRGFDASSPAASGPVILAWAGPLALPTLGATQQEGFTVDTTIDLTYKLDAPNVQTCSAEGVDAYDKFGFARWLGDVIAGLSKVSMQGPRGSLDKLTYDATFAVTRSRTAGGSLTVVFFNAGADTTRSRADTQHLRIVISGPNSIASNIGSPPTGAAKSAKPAGQIQNLSSSPPAAR